MGYMGSQYERSTTPQRKRPWSRTIIVPSKKVDADGNEENDDHERVTQSYAQAIVAGGIIIDRLPIPLMVSKFGLHKKNSCTE